MCGWEAPLHLALGAVVEDCGEHVRLSEVLVKLMFLVGNQINIEDVEYGQTIVFDKGTVQIQQILNLLLQQRQIWFAVLMILSVMLDSNLLDRQVQWFNMLGARVGRMRRCSVLSWIYALF